MRDDGVGVRIVEHLAETVGGRRPDVEFVDLGTSMMAAVHAMAGREKAVFVDCAMMGETPATCRRFGPGEVRSGKALPRMSLHEGDLLQGIHISETLGECPGEIVIIGIQPESVEPGEELSPALSERLEEYAQAVMAELPAP
jgi:hydrogenase maturation protease